MISNPCKSEAKEVETEGVLEVWLEDSLPKWKFLFFLSIIFGVQMVFATEEIGTRNSSSSSDVISKLVGRQRGSLSLDLLKNDIDEDKLLSKHWIRSNEGDFNTLQRTYSFDVVLDDRKIKVCPHVIWLWAIFFLHHIFIKKWLCDSPHSSMRTLHHSCCHIHSVYKIMKNKRRREREKKKPPQISNLGFWTPTTPETTGPIETPNFKIKGTLVCLLMLW